MAQSAFSRDILKWLQGLDLSYSVKNPRRDFANGFIVAEIFSRYYPADVQMHSYDNGTSLQKKLDNWALLDKFFKKREIPLNPTTVEGTIHAKPGSAIELVESIYSFLTKKSITKPSTNVADQFADNTELPSYAKPTASKAVKEGISAGELVMKPDLQYPVTKASSIIEQHERHKKDEKRSETVGYASRFSLMKPSSSETGSKISKSPSQMVSQAAPSNEVQFREVKVRPVERSIAQGRSNRIPEAQSASNQPESKPASRASSAGRVRSARGTSPAIIPPARPKEAFVVLGTIGSIILNTLQGTQLKLELENQRNVCEGFIEKCPKLPEHVIVNVFRATMDNMGLICSSIADNFHEFPVLLSTFFPLFHLPDQYSRSIENLSEIYTELAANLSTNFQADMWKIFYLQIIPKLSSIIRARIHWRMTLLRIILAYCPSDVHSRIECINQLQLSIQDFDVFYLSLAKLASMDSLIATPTLLNTYASHAMAAMGTNSPNSRSSGLAIIAVISQQDTRFVMGLFDRLSAYSDDPWWEVQAQILVIAAKLLRAIQKGSAQSYRIYTTVHNILNEKCSPLVQKIGLIYLTPVLEFHPDLYKIYLITLLLMPENMRDNLLQDDPSLVEDIQPNGIVAGNYSITSLPSEWNDLGITNALSAHVIGEKLDYLEKEHIDIFLVATKHEFNENEIPIWAQVFYQMKNYFYVSLCDELLCETACAIVYRFVFNLGKLSFQTLPTFVTSLRMLFPNGSLRCQQLVIELLGHMYNISDDMQYSMRDALGLRQDILNEMKRNPDFREFARLIQM